MKCKLVTIVVLTFLLNSCSVFLDPGGAKLYEIVSEFKSNHKATLEDEVFFKERYLKELKNRLLSIQHGSGVYYNPQKTEVIARTMDTLLDVNVNFILSDPDKNETIYFITYLTGTFVVPNDSIESRIVDQTVMSDAIYVDGNTGKVKIILVYNTPYSYKYNTIASNDFAIINYQDENMKDIFVRYKYYKRYYRSNRKLNPHFWNHIRHSPESMELEPKKYWRE